MGFSAKQTESGGAAPLVQQEKCVLCLCLLGGDDEDDMAHRLCCSCKTRPEARRLGFVLPPSSQQPTAAAWRGKSARGFTAAEKSLIAKVNGFIPAQQLLALLNERLVCDLGPDAQRYTIDQLYQQIGDASSGVPEGGYDWPSLRKLLAAAKRDKILDSITQQVINDFALVFSLNQKQLMVIKETILQAKED